MSKPYINWYYSQWWELKVRNRSFMTNDLIKKISGLNWPAVHNIRVDCSSADDLTKPHYDSKHNDNLYISNVINSKAVELHIDVRTHDTEVSVAFRVIGSDCTVKRWRNKSIRVLRNKLHTCDFWTMVFEGSKAEVGLRVPKLHFPVRTTSGKDLIQELKPSVMIERLTFPLAEKSKEWIS